MEELLIRAVFYRIMQEWLGAWMALALAALLFGAAHLSNPNASWVAGVAIVLEAGSCWPGLPGHRPRVAAHWPAPGLVLHPGGIFAMVVCLTGAGYFFVARIARGRASGAIPSSPAALP